MILKDFNLPTTSRPNVLRQAIDTYGKTGQIDMAIEEMAELTQALLKERRAAKNQDVPAIKEAEQHIYEETADVIIMLLQLYLIFGHRKEVQDNINSKVARLAQRLGIEIGDMAEERKHELTKDIGLSFTTINTDGEYVNWEFSSVEDLRNQWMDDDPDVPANDDPVTECELRAVPIYVNNFLDIIKLLGIEQEREEIE